MKEVLEADGESWNNLERSWELVEDFCLGDRFSSCMTWACLKNSRILCISSFSIIRIILSTISIFSSSPDLDLAPLLFFLSRVLSLPSTFSFLQTLPLDRLPAHKHLPHTPLRRYTRAPRDLRLADNALWRGPVRHGKERGKERRSGVVGYGTLERRGVVGRGGDNGFIWWCGA